jgi:hypothetical protein
MAAAAVLLGPDPRLATCGVAVGKRVEVDLDQVAQTLSTEIADSLESYWSTAHQLWEQGSGKAVLIRRRIMTSRQVDRKDSRIDLHAELAALEELPGGDIIVEALLGQDVDLDALANYTVSQDGNETAVTITHRSLDWPDALGGPGAPGELHRTITVTANHAKWRDRKVRRLVRIDVSVDEVWPDPTGL